jgi:predicted ATP-grasp superfamily ATP-dependent carboligase
MANILVTDGEQRAALALVRSLAAAGHGVHVCGSRRRTLAGASRHARGYRSVPDPLHEPDAFADAVAELCTEWSLDLVIPVAEPAVLALLPHRERLLPARIPFPGLGAFLRVTDKERVLAAAAECGIAVPRQWVLRGPGGIAGLAGELAFPVVLKPARSVGEAGGERVKLGVTYAASHADLRGRVEALPAAAFPLLLQQRVNGPGIGVFLLVWEGETVAAFSHRRIREKPPSGGVSVYRESIEADPDLVARARRLLEALGWWGVAMVEFKLDTATGTPYLMEINGRFWGSLQLAVDAGVDFPRLLVECALGDRPAPVTRYRAGVRSRWWWGDVDHLLLRLRKSREALALPPGAPRRSRVLREFLTLWRPGDRGEVFRLSDPMPAFREILDWLRRR